MEQSGYLVIEPIYVYFSNFKLLLSVKNSKYSYLCFTITLYQDYVHRYAAWLCPVFSEPFQYKSIELLNAWLKYTLDYSW